MGTFKVKLSDVASLLGNINFYLIKLSWQGFILTARPYRHSNRRAAMASHDLINFFQVFMSQAVADEAVFMIERVCTASPSQAWCHNGNDIA